MSFAGTESVITMYWNDFRKEVKAKRTGNNENGASGAGANILQSGEMVVQRLIA